MLVEETPDNAALVPFLSLRVRLARFWADWKVKHSHTDNETFGDKPDNQNSQK